MTIKCTICKGSSELKSFYLKIQKLSGYEYYDQVRSILSQWWKNSFWKIVIYFNGRVLARVSCSVRAIWHGNKVEKVIKRVVLHNTHRKKLLEQVEYTRFSKSKILAPDFCLHNQLMFFNFLINIFWICEQIHR